MKYQSLSITEKAIVNNNLINLIKNDMLNAPFIDQKGLKQLLKFDVKQKGDFYYVTMSILFGLFNVRISPKFTNETLAYLELFAVTKIYDYLTDNFFKWVLSK